MASIKDVAKESGVSVATVSRVINGTAAVSEATQTARRASLWLCFRPLPTLFAAALYAPLTRQRRQRDIIL